MSEFVDDRLPFSLDTGVHRHRTISPQVEADAAATRHCDRNSCQYGLYMWTDIVVAAGSDLRTREPASPGVVAAQEIEHGLPWVSVMLPVSRVVGPER